MVVAKCHGFVGANLERAARRLRSPLAGRLVREASRAKKQHRFQVIGIDA